MPRPLLLLALLPLAGCMSEVALTRSGFLTSYEVLEVEPNERARESWVAPGADLAPYRAVVIEPLVVDLVEGSEDALTGEQAALVGEQYRRWVLTGLDGSLEVVDEAGPGVLRLRTAITQVDTTNMVVNWITGLGILWPLDYGGGTFEVEVVDSETGEVLAAMVNADRATAWNGISAMIRIGHLCQAAEETAGWAAAAAGG